MADALLDAAIAQFGEHGLAGASTRAIAGAAGVAMSTITYRHGGKEGLYLAAARHIAGMIGNHLTPVLAQTGAEPVARAVSIIRGVAGLMLSEESAAWARFILREQMAPSEAFELLWEGAMRPILDALTECVAAAGNERDPRAARLAAMTLMGQALVFRAARASALRALNRQVIEGSDLVAVLDRLEANVRAILKPLEGR